MAACMACLRQCGNGSGTTTRSSWWCMVWGAWCEQWGVATKGETVAPHDTPHRVGQHMAHGPRGGCARKCVDGHDHMVVVAVDATNKQRHVVRGKQSVCWHNSGTQHTLVGHHQHTTTHRAGTFMSSRWHTKCQVCASPSPAAAVCGHGQGTHHTSPLAFTNSSHFVVHWGWWAALGKPNEEATMAGQPLPVATSKSASGTMWFVCLSFHKPDTHMRVPGGRSSLWLIVLGVDVWATSKQFVQSTKHSVWCVVCGSCAHTRPRCATTHTQSAISPG